VSLSVKNIEAVANVSVHILGIDGDTEYEMDHFIEKLGDVFGIEIDVVDDTEWFHVTNAICDPSMLAIAMPNKLYCEIEQGKPEALFIFFHELGHLLLAHKPVLHFSEISATEQEDAEWQADLFSETVLKIMMGARRARIRTRPKQLTLSLE